MTRLKRTIQLDFHTMPKITDFGAEFDAKEFAKTLADAHVQSINAFAICNIGFAYYPTKIGTPYPYLKGDMFGDIVRECHARGIEVVAYVNATLSHEQQRKHPEWCRIDDTGHVLAEKDRAGNFFRTLCYNSDAYKEYLLGVVKEICEYDIDGMFFDCIYPRPCYCNKCTEDMIARGIDINDKAAVTSFAYENIQKLADELRNIVPKDKNIIYNAIPLEDNRERQYRGEIEHIPIAWGYEAVPMDAAYQRPWYGEENVQYMTGRFQKCWGDFGGYKGKIALQNDMYDALLNGIGICIGDHMHPAKNLNKDMYKQFGEIFEEYMQYEKWTDDAKLIADVAVLRNLFDPTSLAKGKDSRNYVAVQGASRILAELKYNFDVINEKMDFDKYKVIILPDGAVMTENLKAKLESYIKNGGKVISTGESGLNKEKTGFALDAWNFLEFDKLETTDNSFYSLKKDIEEITLDWAMYAPGILMKNKGGEEIAAHVPAYFTKHWDGLHGYHYTPPAKEIGYSAMAMSDNICQISFKVFE
ncbi:MAG: beta-galactosidase trimerization domain-containing protein, partial [Clostridia bacterium]|nr:beta-galactosidase trimerization domain-containing protein [Clostridia bacterium]